jgi:Holliday junction DNA helicase RuvB
LIDEAHSLSRDAQQVLFSALDEAKIPAVTEKGRLNRSEARSVAACTPILATDQPGNVKPALQSRLTPIEFVPYTLRELKTIAERVAELEGIEITPQGARRLAEVSQGSPRSIARRIDAMHLFWPDIKKFGLEHVAELLVHEGVDDLGLWPSQRLYLQTLAASPRGACSLERLAIKLGCDPTNIRRTVEPHLIERGWVEPHSGRGRMITSEGRAITPPSSAEDDAGDA